MRAVLLLVLLGGCATAKPRPPEECICHCAVESRPCVCEVAPCHCSVEPQPIIMTPGIYDDVKNTLPQPIPIPDEFPGCDPEAGECG